MKRVLLIDDNDDIRDSTAEILELANYTVETAANGKEGIQKAMDCSPDIILCDIMMPVMDGYGVFHAASRHEKLQHVPFIFLSARAERSDLRKGMELGADDYITKPFNPTELLNAIASRLKRSDRIYHDQPEPVTIRSGGIQALVEGRHENHYRRKQIVYSEGNHPNRLFYVLSGKLKVFRSNEEGKELVTDIVGPGEFLGYTALLQGSVYSDTATAIVDAELAIIPCEDFRELLERDNAAARQFLQWMAEGITRKQDQMLRLAYCSLRRKVADALLYLLSREKKNEKDSQWIEIGRECLASIAGTATESLIRTLSDFRNEGIIEICEGIIRIRDLERLKVMPN